MKAPTARDKQVSVGASNISTPCTRCLADDLLATQASEPGKFWLASWWGTAGHERLEKQMPDHWLKEYRMTLFDIDGYGEVESTTDLYLPDLLLSLDYKTTTRTKLRTYQRVFNGDESESLLPAKFTIDKYLNQVMLYGMGCEDEGKTVEHAGLFFLCRDGTGDNDVWWHTLPYDREQAEHVAERAKLLWQWLQDGGDTTELTSAPGCWYCVNMRGLVGPRKTIEREEIDL